MQAENYTAMYKLNGYNTIHQMSVCQTFLAIL